MFTLNFKKFLLFLGDIFCLYFSLLITLKLRFWENFNWQIFQIHLLPFTLLYLFYLIIFYIFGFYDFDFLPPSSLFYSRFFLVLGLALALGMIFFYLTPFFEIAPKTNLILNVIIFGFLIIIWRKFFYFIFSSYFLKKVAIVGENPQLSELIREILHRPYLGYKLVSLNPQKNLISQIQKEKVNTLILAENLKENSILIQNLYQLLPLKINFLDFSQAFEIICGKIPLAFVGQSWFLENLREGKKVFYDKSKRIIEIFLAFLFLFLTLPLWLLIALLIKLEDKGPIFYFQERIGKDGKKFLLIKFRSMKKNSEITPCWAKENDPRITKIGKILRKTHLDELPQLLNILKGELSLVGPRPERPEFVWQLEKQIPHYQLRHLIKPGLSGWAQIKFGYGRSVADSYEKFQYDLYYLKNRSFLLDLEILLKTFQLFFKKES